MPFKSEKQRRYLWANEPEIARDWTDTYGSGIHKALGGRIGFQEGDQVDSVKHAVMLKQIDKLEKMIASGVDFDGSLQKSLDKLLATPTTGLGTGPVEEVEETEELKPDFTKIKQMSMIPSWEDLKAGWENLTYSEPTPPEGIMKAGGYPFMDPTDGNYIPREIMTANWSESDDLEAQQVDAQRQMELARLANMQQYSTETAEEENDSGNWLMKALSYMPLVGKNTRSGALMRMLGNRFMPDGGITSMFNRPTSAQQQATQRFMQNYNVGRNPTTGRMVGGPFAGRNLPGTSMFGSKTPQEMAQNWMKKYGDMEYKTKKQQQKQEQIKNLANIKPKTPSRPYVAPLGPRGNGGNQGNQSHRGGAPSHSTRTLMASGGLASLWRE